MGPRAAAILVVLAGLLGAFLYFYELEGEEGRKEAEAREDRVFGDLEADEVEALWLGEDGSVRVERVEAGWRVREPVDFPADDATLDSLVGTLARLDSEGEIDDPQAPGVYGLGEDARVIRFRARGEERSLRTGRKTPVGGNSYVGSSDSERVYMVPTWRLNALDKSLDELRDRRVLRFDRNAVRRVEATWPGGGIEVERRDGGWWMLAPHPGRADDESVDDLLSELAFLRAEGFVDEELDAAEAGLEEPALAVQLGLAPPQAGGEARDDAAPDPETAPGGSLRFALGGLRSQGDRLARGAVPGTLYRVAGERLGDFSRKESDYRFRELAAFESADARRLLLRFEDADGRRLEAEASRSEGSWSSQPVELVAGRAATLVSELSRLKGRDVAVEEPDEAALSALGLAPPRAVLRVEGAAPEEGEPAPELAHVLLGEVDADLGIPARRGGGGPVYYLDGDLAESLPVGLEAFENRFVAPEQGGEVEDGDAAPDFSADPRLLEDEQP